MNKKTFQANASFTHSVCTNAICSLLMCLFRELNACVCGVVFVPYFCLHELQSKSFCINFLL